jgi:hypothetical protein
MSLDKSFLTRCYSGSNDGPAYWLYRTTDKLDAVQAPLYFKAAYHDFQNGDLLLVRAADGVLEFEISGARVFPVAITVSPITVLSGPNVRVINSLEDFEHDDQFIYLRPNTGYLLIANVDIGARTFTDPQGPISIEGISANFCGLTCSGTAALFPFTRSTTLRRMSITLGASQDFFSCDFGGIADVVAEYVSIINGNFGSIRNGTVMIWERSRLNNCGALSIGGNWGLLRFETPVVLNMPTNETAFVIEADASIDRSINFTGGIWVLEATNTGIEVKAGATIPTESFILANNEFDGVGTPVQGLGPTDLEPLYRGNTPLADTIDLGGWSLTGNATPTPINVIGQYEVVAGVTVVSDATTHFVHTPSPNNLEFVGARTRTMSVSGTLGVESASTNQVAQLVVLKNGLPVNSTTILTSLEGSAGTRVSAVPIQGVFNVGVGDDIKLAIANNTSTADLTVTEANFHIVQAI